MEFFRVEPHRMVPCGAFEYPAGVLQFGRDEQTSDADARIFLICQTVLRPAQRHVSAHFSCHAGEKAAVLRQKAEGYIPFGTGPHQGGASARVAHRDHAFEIVERHPADFFPLLRHHDIFPIQRQIGIGRGDIQRILQNSHNPSSSFRQRFI